jgi:hypothetical protein
MFSRTIRNTLAVTALAGAGLLAAAAPSFAAGGPSSTAQATVTVNLNITFAFDGGQASFGLAPGVTDHDAIGFTIVTNDHLGYSLSLAAPDLTSGGPTIPAGSLSYATFQGGGQVGVTQQLSNSPATVLSVTGHASSPAGDDYTQDWTANVLGNTPPGAYQTTLTYVATAL